MTMQIINNQISEIIQSYVRIQSAENELQSKWRKPLLTIYAQQRARYDHELENFNNQRTVFSRRLRVGIWMSTILLILGILVLPGLILINEIGDFRGPLFCFSPLLILSGLTGWAIIIVLWIWQRDQKKPQLPQNPLKTDLFYPLMPLWKEGLVGSLPGKKPHPGATGEFHFITRLLSLADNSYILYGLQQRQGEDVDIILVGPKGIWVFEVKYLKGLIRWHDGVWSQIQSTRRINPSQRFEIREPNQAFENQWQQAADDVLETIKRHAADLVSRSPDITQIKGGLVFTHPKGRYDIPPGCPFNWGVVPFWLEKTQSLPNIEGMDEYAVMKIMDVLLERNHQVARIEQPRSMMDHTENIVSSAEKNIKLWIEKNKLEELPNL